MTNAKKKKNRRLKKTVRKTLGTLCLVSALTVAAIPVDNLQADTQEPLKVTVDAENCRIPLVDDSEVIYTTGDGKFQFAYVSTNDAAASNKVAVILGYDGGRLENGVLTIPNTVDAYRKYSENLGTTFGYCAVGKSGNYLFYEVQVEKTDEWGNVITEDDKDKPVLDEEGNPVKDPISGDYVFEQKPVYEKQYKPCYYTDYDKWSELEVDEFYYDASTVSGSGTSRYVRTTDSTVQRIQGAEVRYIGNQSLIAGTGDDAGTWTIAPGIVDTPEEGIFRGEKAGNIETLYVGSSLSGIGNYAFNGCTNLTSIKLENGLDTIGNYAFANCVNLQAVDVEVSAMITTIGDHAFYNCQALSYFRTPRHVSQIGDSAFEGCIDLAAVELCGEGMNVQLSKLGNNVFRNCSSLKEVILPRSYQESDLDISMWEGCTSLEHITSQNGNVNFVSNKSFTFEDFKETVPDSFYFEGIKNSPLHTTATDNSIAFKYLDDDIYEITTESDGKKAVYQVNSNNELIYCDISSGLSEVDIPSTIGPYQITTIWSTSFRNSCSLEKITIPSSIRTIEKDAFRGCHNLETVIFTEPVNVTNIGANAFQTQDLENMSHQANCKNTTLKEKPVLQFVGPISYDCVPFTYAMEPGSNINRGSQVRTYITYYSSWPENLQIQYNPDTDKNELINYPTFSDITTLGTLSKEQALKEYPYMTTNNVEDYLEAAKSAVEKYNDPALKNTMTDYEKEIIDAALNIVLPEGVESIKDGLFSTKEKESLENRDKTLTAYSLVEIPSYAFKEFDNLTKINLVSGTTSIGDHAFDSCTALEEVYLPDTLSNMGIRPFAGCSELSEVYLSGNPYFTCDNSIIYGLDEDGNKYKIIEYLEGRESGVIMPDEFAGITEMAEEAFMETNVSSVDLRESEIKDIPANAFADTGNLFAVYLPDTWESITDRAFENSKLQYLEIPGSQGYIGNDAFINHRDKSALTFYCEDGSSAKIYADKNGIKTTSKPIVLSYTVRFWDYDNVLLDTQTVLAGQDAVPPAVEGREGYIHIGWAPDYHGINRDMDITAQYEAEDPDAHKFTVTFLDHDDTVLKTMLVAPGADAEPPIDPVRSGYTFIGWRPAVTNIQEDTTIYAQYEKKDSSLSQLMVRFIDYDDTVLYTQKVYYGEDAIMPQDPSREGYVFTGWRPAITEITQDLDTYAQYEKIDGSVDDGTGDGNGDNTGDGNDDGTGGGSGDGSGGGDGNGTGNGNGTGGNNGQTTTKLYNLTVQNGSGSGSYAAGSQPIIIANDPAAKQEFSHWTISPEGTKIASTVLTATVITMPEGDVTVTAHYKAKTATGTTVTGSGNSSSSNNRPNNSGTIGGGTTVVIDKNGLSNTGVVSATVNGSSDNFTIKITESAEASDAAVRALMAEFGDLSDIKYFPMDISLYDSTGKRKITDTTGLSIKITLPLPDSLIQYAGNNKMASVVESRLEKLNAKFTTISGVPCVTFTAEHFSPYVMYVDTSNLTAGVITDDTPKTGDGIHPKWFLSIGLACSSFVLFMKKDKRKLAKVRA